MRRMVGGAVAAVLILFTPSCSIEQLTSTTPARSKIEFVVTSDSLVILGGTLPIIVKGSLSSLPATARVVWSTSDASVATVDTTGKVRGAGIGLVRINARLLGPDLDTGIVRSLDFRVKYRGIAIAPIDSMTGLGQTVTPLVRGLDSANVLRGTVVATLSSSDPRVIAAEATTLTAVKNGRATITATFDGATADVSAKVRQVAKSVSFAASPLVFRALERDTMVAVTVLDVLDNVMTVVPTWSAGNAAAASVTAGGMLRAHQVTATLFRASVDTVTATLPVTVSQVIATVTKLAGDAQSQTAGRAVAIAPAVSVKDAGGAGIPGVPVTFSVLSGSGALTGATTTTSAAGVATVGSWTLGTIAGTNSLSAVGGGVTQTFTATGIPGAPARVRFTSAPAGTLPILAGTALAPSVAASVLDANGNVATSASTTVSLALIGPPGGASLDGTTSIAAVAGVATYGSLKASAPWGSYRLVASAAGLVPDTTAAFTVLGPPAKLAFVAQPTNAASSATLPSVTVAVQDAAGATLAAASNSVSLAIGSNPGGASLSGGAPTSPAAGVASFPGLSLNKAGTGYSLIATATGLTSATSSAFNIAPAGATALSLVAAPATASNATAMTPAVQVAVTDADGNTATAATGTIVATVASGAGVTISNATAPIVSGIATLGALTLTGTAGPVTLQFTDGTRSITSAPITLAAGAPTGLAFVSAPGAEALNGTPFSQQPVVRLVDVSGNTVPTSGVLTATITSGSGGALVGATASITAGVGTFTALGLSGTAGTFTLQFSDGVRTLSSPAIALGAAAANGVALATAPPTSATNGIALGVQPVVTVVDGSGNIVTTASGIMTATIESGTGGVLASSTATITNGVARFAGLTLSGIAGVYTLRFSDGTRSVTSGSVTLGTGAASALSIGTPLPTTSLAGQALVPPPVMKVVDASGNTVTSATGTMTATIASGSNGSLTGATAPIVGGIATFATLALSGPTGLFTVKFSDGTLNVTSAAVMVTNPAAVVIVPTLSATATNGAILSVQPVVKVVDDSGATVTSANGTMTASIVAGTGAALLNATTPLTAGVATFSALELRGLAGVFTLRFSDGTRTVNSLTVTLGVGPASALVLTTAPSAAATTGAAFAQQPVVRVVDVGGNTVATATGTMTATLAGGSGAVLSSATAPITAGVATFSGLALIGAPGDFSLQFSDGSRGVTSGTVALGSAVANAIVFTTGPPASAINGVAFSPQPSVKVVDLSGNTVTSASGTVTATIASGTGGTLVNATATLTRGVATFTSLGLNGTAGSFTLQVSDGTRTVTSGAIALSAGSASSLAFASAPSTAATDGIAFGTQPAIRVVDAENNTVASATGTITATIASGTGAILASASAPITAGVATFSALRLTGTVGTFTLQFSDGRRTINSGPITLGPGAASAVQLRTAPSATGTNGVALATQPVVTVRDVGGNVVTSASGTMTATIVSGSGTTLTGATTTIADGVATFSGLTLSGTVGDFTLQFSDGTRTTTSGTISVSPGAAASIAFVPGTVPTAAASNGLPLPVQPRVRVLDASGNVVTSATGTMTASIFAGSGGTLLNATTAITAGVATFTTLGLNGTAGEFTLRFSDGTRTLSSSAITLRAGAASAVVIAGAPSETATNGDALASQPVVTVVDAVGNVVTGATGTMTVTIGSGPAGALVNATAPITAGVAVFSGLTLTGPVGTFTLLFSDGSRSIGSGPIALAPGAQKSIVLTVALLGTVRSGIPFSTQPSVKIVDAGGNTLDVSGTVTATVATGSGALVNNTATLTAGVATFTALTLTGTAGPFTLTLTNGTVSVTGTVTLSAGPASGLNLSTPPPALVTDDIAFSPQPIVRIVDADNNTVLDATGTITSNIATGTGAVLANTTARITAGVATFSGMKLTGTTGTFTLHFVEGSRYIASDDITLVAGEATSLQLTDGSPSSGTNGVPLSTQPIVTVRDVGGNVVTSASGTMTATIASGPASTLTGATATIVRGIATFSGLTFTGSAGDFTVQFSDGTLTTTSGTIAIKP